MTDRGTIETETVVIAAGMWGRQLGALAGVSLPLQAAEHYYLLTDDVEWAHPDLPVVEDPDRYGYYREEGGGVLVGLFEPKAAPWSLDRIPHDLGYAVLEPDWDRVGGFLSDAMDRFPSLHQAGIRQFFCGPESFTRGQRAAARRGARAPRVLRGLRAELPRDPARRAARVRSSRSGSSTASRRWTSPACPSTG